MRDGDLPDPTPLVEGLRLHGASGGMSIAADVAMASNTCSKGALAILWIAGMTACSWSGADSEPGRSGTGGGAGTTTASSGAEGDGVGGGTGTTGATGGSGAAPVGDNAYYDSLVAHASHFAGRAYRSDVDVEADDGKPDPTRLHYDPIVDAARFVFPPDVGNAKQLRHVHEGVGSGNLFYCWEARWGIGWAGEGTVDGIPTHKAFQISTWEGKAGGGGLYLEPRMSYKVGSAPDEIGTVNVRTYDQTPPIEVGGGDTLAPQTGEFMVHADTWIRHWVYVDFDNQEFSYWIGAPGEGVVQIHDRVFHHLDATLYTFWFEFNSSSVRVGGDEIYIWGKNLAILRDLPGYDEAQALVDAGAE